MQKPWVGYQEEKFVDFFSSVGCWTFLSITLLSIRSGYRSGAEGCRLTGSDRQEQKVDRRSAQSQRRKGPFQGQERPRRGEEVCIFIWWWRWWRQSATHLGSGQIA